MKAAYLDTSFLTPRSWWRSRWVDPAGGASGRSPAGMLLSAEFLAAEFLAVAKREELPDQEVEKAFGAIRWVLRDSTALSSRPL